MHSAFTEDALSKRETTDTQGVGLVRPQTDSQHEPTVPVAATESRS